MKGFQRGLLPCSCGGSPHTAALVAITGGPGAGKTAVLELALRSFCSHVGVIPEAASLVFGGGFPRHASDVARRAAQRAIFHVQRELEELVVQEASVAVALCDRGTVDGAAYWPGTVDSYWEAVHTTHREQLRRYAAVIHLETPALEQGYNHQNALRMETAAEARAIDQRILAAWQDHPKRAVVSSTDEFLLKASQALQLVRAELPPCCHSHPLPGDESNTI